MRLLERDLQTFWLARYTGETEAVNASGYYTGERSQSYATKEKCVGHISQPSGFASYSPPGISTEYDRTIITESDLSIKTSDRIWIDADPDTLPPDYVVTKVAVSKDECLLGVKEVSLRA